MPPQFVQGNRGNTMLLTYFRVWVFLAGNPEAMEILNSIEGSLENVPMSVLSSDNDTVVPNSTNMVVIEMASLPLPAWPQQELCCCHKNMCVWKHTTSTPMAMIYNYLASCDVFNSYVGCARCVIYKRLALERVNSGPLDHAWLANLMLFSVFCLNCVIGCEYVIPLTWSRNFGWLCPM